MMFKEFLFEKTQTPDYSIDSFIKKYEKVKDDVTKMKDDAENKEMEMDAKKKELDSKKDLDDEEEESDKNVEDPKKDKKDKHGSWEKFREKKEGSSEN